VVATGPAVIVSETSRSIVNPRLTILAVQICDAFNVQLTAQWGTERATNTRLARQEFGRDRGGGCERKESGNDNGELHGGGGCVLVISL
jgi:hypothetical protein